jgi:hypothetical protein
MVLTIVLVVGTDFFGLDLISLQGHFLKTAIKKQKPCMQDIIKHTGLFLCKGACVPRKTSLPLFCKTAKLAVCWFLS